MGAWSDDDVVNGEPGDPVVRLGDRIRLRMPCGSDLDTTVRGIENIRYAKMPEKIAFPVLLPEAITKDDIPVGTEVLLLEQRYETVQSDKLGSCTGRRDSGSVTYRLSLTCRQ